MLLKEIDKEKRKISEILTDLEEYFGTKITDRQKEMYIEDLIEMGSERTYAAALSYRRGWGNTVFPLPGVLRKEVFFYKSTTKNNEAGPNWHLSKE